MTSHKQKFFLRAVRITLHTTLAAGILLGGAPLIALAQTYVPPANLGLPGRREGGGTRGCWQTDEVMPSATPLMALVPEDTFGYTTEAYPTFFVYVPPFYAEKAKAAEFLVTDEAGTEIYKASFQASDTAGVISIALPANANLPELEVGKNYQWSFALVCDPTDRSADLVVDSTIQRIVPSSDLSAAIEAATPEEIPNIYAQSSIWYDALAALVHLEQQPGNNVSTQWTNLMSSVGLENIPINTPREPMTLSSELP
jgi:Domain of Unknown Function (DUF928)